MSDTGEEMSYTSEEMSSTGEEMSDKSEEMSDKSEELSDVNEEMSDTGKEMHDTDEEGFDSDEDMPSLEEIPVEEMDNQDEDYKLDRFQQMEWMAHPDGVTLLKRYPKHIASAGVDGYIKIWKVDFKTGDANCVKTFHHGTNRIRHFAFNPDNTKLVSVGVEELSVKLWDVGTIQYTPLEHSYLYEQDRFPAQPNCVAFYPVDENRFLVGYENGDIVSWNRTTLKIVVVYGGNKLPIQSIVFLSNCKFFATLTNSDAVGLWELKKSWKFNFVKTMPVPVPRAQALVVQDRQGLFYQTLKEGVVAFENLEKSDDFDWRWKTFDDEEQWIEDMSIVPDVSPDQLLVASGNSRGKMHVWKWDSEKLVRAEWAHVGWCSCVLWDVMNNEAGSKLLFSGGSDGYIKVWRVSWPVPVGE